MLYAGVGAHALASGDRLDFESNDQQQKKTVHTALPNNLRFPRVVQTARALGVGPRRVGLWMHEGPLLAHWATGRPTALRTIMADLGRSVSEHSSWLRPEEKAGTGGRSN